MTNQRMVVAVIFIVAAALRVSAGEVGPGIHRGIKCKAAPQYTYDVCVPRAYAEETGRRFPVLFISSPGGNPGFMGTENWADENSVLLVTINDTENNQEFSQWDEIQTAVMDSVETSLRLHPCLRFSMGFSGGGMASMRLARRYGEKFAGVVMLGHSGNGEDRGLPKHITVAFVHGENDRTHSIGSVESVFKKLKSRGHIVRKIVGDWGHETGAVEHRLLLLSWMLDLSRLVHPLLSEDERAEARREIKRRVEALPNTPDAAQRLKNAEGLLELPDSEKWPEIQALYAAWFSAKYDLASANTDIVDRHEALNALFNDERTRKCAAADQKRLAAELSDMRKKQPVKTEWAARQMYDQIAAFEAKAGQNKTKLLQAAQSYAALARSYPDTRAGKKAAEDARRLGEALGIPVQ
ncbi:MAG TPA: hypothetical protein ENN09_00630 [Planctomycetes bacterium]|nr:hypothetical protein [Planctomycetota bacterium]